MSPPHPPTLAAWLLQRILSGPHRDVIVGDILEDFGARRSTSWFWRQAITAILIDVARDIREHKLLAARTVLIGSGVLLVFHRILVPFVLNVFPAPRVESSWLVGALFTTRWCAGFVAAGIVIATLHRRHIAAMLTIYACAIYAWQALFGFNARFTSGFSMAVHVFVLAPLSVVVAGMWAGSGDINVRLSAIARRGSAGSASVGTARERSTR